MLANHLRRCLQRKAPQAINAAERHIFTDSVLDQALPATVPATRKGGFLSSLFGGSGARVITPLDEPLSGVTVLPPIELSSTPAETKITTLPNGFKIASEDRPGPTTSVGLYVDSGSIYESPVESGVSHLLEKMAFKSTKNRSHFRLIREVEALGANIMATASREQMSYTGDALESYLPELVELLADSVRNPKFLPWEVAEQVGALKRELETIGATPEAPLIEALHAAAYAGALGSPLIASPLNLSHFDSTLLKNFVEANYTAPRMVLAASGVAHDDLVKLAEPLFGDMARAPVPLPPASQYVGGDWRQAAQSPLTHMALGFEFKGGWRDEKGAIALTVLQILLGGGGSFSAGGPGKGMHSRLYVQVLNNHAWVTHIAAFNQCYNETGIFGIYASCDSGRVVEMVDIICRQLISVANGDISPAELARAKAATVSSVLINLESRVITTEDIGRQTLTYGHRNPILSFVDTVEKLTAGDLASLAKRVLTTPLSMASWGDVVHVPTRDEVAKRFG